MANTTAIAKDGERWDQLAQRAYGDPMLMNRIIAANPNLGITGRLKGGTVVIVPILENQPETTNAALLPPWKR